MTKLISVATKQAFKMKNITKGKRVVSKKRKSMNKVHTKKTRKSKKIKKSSPSTSLECSESQTISNTIIDESTSPMLSSKDSQSDRTINSGKNNEHLSESHSSKLMDSDHNSNDINKDEILSLDVGSTFKQGRYKVQRKLGYGAFSTVWLAWDEKDNKYVALKIQNCSKDCIAAAREEIKIHKEVAKSNVVGEKAVVKLLDHFEHNISRSRKHICMVFEYLGDNLLTLIKANKYKGLPLDIVKNLAKQILTGLNYLHKDLKIIHTDLKPENVLLVSPLNPSIDPRLSLNENFTHAKQRRSSTPPPSKLRLNLNLSQNKDMSLNKHQHDHNNEKLLQTSSEIGSQSHSPRRNENINNNPNDTTINNEVQIDEGQLASEPESLDRLAIDSDPDIARDLNISDKRKKPSRPSNSIDIRCKIVDLGTACWTNKIFTNDIQTRQYRCPEVLLGCNYSTSADMWSFGCLVFELATGNVLFDPRTGGSAYNRDEDHLAQIMEILGPIPKSLASKGIHSHNYLTKNGELKHRKPNGHCSLYKLLVNEYNFNEKDAKDFAGFLLPLLEVNPNKRPSAEESLHHPWLNSS
ncbi:hypothetical protein KC19_12G176200 [Ceratodon purpureus]|uniref:non-specific serine/threonine protein kinase n=1 Tax=Ceratodon purpureus TaxID=3225 RepID=A0A8T0G8D2_CERPU|nr:hypothetical protein KC19_12G176200 [Ceratodon purpureus]